MLRSLLLSLFLLLVAVPVVGAQDVRYVRDIDAMTDGDRSYLMLDGQAFSLSWRCEDDGLNVRVLTKYLGGNRDDQIRVQYRFDDRAPSPPQWWEQHSNNRIAYAPLRWVNDLTEGGIASNRITVEVIDPVDGERLVQRFSLRGLKVGLNRLACYREGNMPVGDPDDPIYS